MGKTTIRPNAGGFIFYTAKDPKKVLHTIWKVARVKDAGMLPSSSSRGYLEFEGVTVRIQDEFECQIEEFVGDDLNHEIIIEFIDWKKIRHGFFELIEGELRDGHLKGESILRLKEILESEEAKLNREPIQKIPHGKIGRPHYPDDEWAWRELYEKKRPREEVKKDWLKRIKEDIRRDNLIDPDSQFKNISKFKWGEKLGK